MALHSNCLWRTPFLAPLGAFYIPLRQIFCLQILQIEQQQALSFWNCSQYEWEPQMMSKEKGTSIKVGTQMFIKGSSGDASASKKKDRCSSRSETSFLCRAVRRLHSFNLHRWDLSLCCMTTNQVIFFTSRRLVSYQNTPLLFLPGNFKTRNG